MSGPRTPGWIYVLASQSHPGIVKIGRTSRHTPGRMIEVDRSECLRVQRGPATPAATRARMRGVVEAGLNEAAVGQEVYGR
jgi:hypothetical protein